jgi:hypothetical protein
MKVDTNVASKAFLFQQMNDTTIIQWHKSQAPTSLCKGKSALFIGGRVHFSRRDGALLKEGWHTEYELAKCERLGCHLSPNSSKLPHVRYEEWGWCHLLRSGQPSLEMRHLSSRGAHLSLMTSPKPNKHVPQLPMKPPHVTTILC